MVELSSTFPQKLKTQNRIVIPKLVAEGLGIKPGDELTITVRRTLKVK